MFLTLDDSATSGSRASGSGVCGSEAGWVQLGSECMDLVVWVQNGPVWVQSV